jgi:penicillin G amidase
MSTRTKVILGVLGTATVMLVAGVLFVRYQIRKSFPPTTGAIQVPGLLAAVDIRRDEFGVPHIQAQNTHDAMMALGIVHAQDRLWQMDMMRRAGEGRLSELFGRSTVPFDRMFRIVGIRRIAENINRSLPPASLERLQWYADGVNAVIAGQKGKYPVEFDLLGYQPEPWAPVHSIIVGRMMAWTLNLSWWSDLTLGAIAERVGLDKALEVFPTYPDSVPPVVRSQEWRRAMTLGLPYLTTAREYLAFTGSAYTLGGSNAWAVAPSRSMTGNVLLANDTHLQLDAPGRWYELQLDAPGYAVRGMSIPGAPGVIAGRNNRIAWGLTNVMADDADFYVERTDSADTTRALYNGAWEPMTVLQETIPVRGDSGEALTVRITRHGPVVTDITTPLQEGRYPFAASMRWTGAEIDDPFEAFDRIDRAGNWKEFTEGVRAFAVPGQNFVYGDVDGNIGYWCGLRLPIRGRQHTIFPLPGWDPAAEWKGWVPFEQLPHTFNPPEGYIATANNKITDDSYPYYISDLWEPPSRFIRLREVLARPGEMFSVEDFERLQNDQYSYHAREIVPFILTAFRDSSIGLPEGATILEYFRNWHFTFAKDDIVTSIYQTFFVHLLRNIYRDEMGPELFHDFLLLSNIPIRVTTRLLAEGTSPWFDDITTPLIETRDDIVRKSLREAVLELRGRFGENTKTWRWGELHTVTLRHLLGRAMPLSIVFNLGPYPVAGGTTTLMSDEYDFNNPFGVTVGPSFRMVIDMANADEMRTVLPSGESGQVYSAHYGDQTRLWLNGGYRIVRASEGSARWDRLTLEPRQ